MKERKGIKFALAEADPDKTIVSMIEWKGSMYVATKKGIYRIEENDTIVRLQFVDKSPKNSC